MKILLNQDPSCPETEVIINCPQADEDILRLVALLRVFQKKLVGIRDGELLRVGRSCIINFRHVRSVRPELGGRWLVTMDNGEQVGVSRQYAGELNAKLREIERSLLK